MPRPMFDPAPATVCADGTSLSIQASASHYCTPQRDHAASYSEVEVGQIHDANGDIVRPPSTWARYHEGDGIYAYVPLSLVEDFISTHGGRS